MAIEEKKIEGCNLWSSGLPSSVTTTTTSIHPLAAEVCETDLNHSAGCTEVSCRGTVVVVQQATNRSRRSTAPHSMPVFFVGHDQAIAETLVAPLTMIMTDELVN